MSQLDVTPRIGLTTQMVSHSVEQVETFAAQAAERRVAMLCFPESSSFGECIAISPRDSLPRAAPAVFTPAFCWRKVACNSARYFVHQPKGTDMKIKTKVRAGGAPPVI